MTQLVKTHGVIRAVANGNLLVVHPGMAGTLTNWDRLLVVPPAALWQCPKSDIGKVIFSETPLAAAIVVIWRLMEI